MRSVFSKENLPRLLLILVTAAAITVTGILFRQSPLRVLPLYVSLVVGALQSRANRYASLIGGINSILYAFVYLYLGLYASAGYALLFSCPIQLVTFILWSRRKYGQSTRFRKMSVRLRVGVSAAFAAVFAGLYFVLRAVGSDYGVLDSLTSLLGILISILTMLAFIEYTWLMFPSGLIGIALHIATMKTYPEQITYVIFSVYSLICVTVQFFRVRKLYAQQQKENDPPTAETETEERI